MDRALNMLKTGICELFFHISLFKFIDRKRFKRGLKVVNFILKINLNKNYEKGVDLWKVKK